MLWTKNINVGVCSVWNVRSKDRNSQKGLDEGAGGTMRRLLKRLMFWLYVKPDGYRIGLWIDTWVQIQFKQRCHQIDIFGMKCKEYILQTTQDKHPPVTTRLRKEGSTRIFVGECSTAVLVVFDREDNFISLRFDGTKWRRTDLAPCVRRVKLADDQVGFLLGSKHTAFIYDEEAVAVFAGQKDPALVEAYLEAVAGENAYIRHRDACGGCTCRSINKQITEAAALRVLCLLRAELRK